RRAARDHGAAGDRGGDGRVRGRARSARERRPHEEPQTDPRLRGRGARRGGAPVRVLGGRLRRGRTAGARSGAAAPGAGSPRRSAGGAPRGPVTRSGETAQVRPWSSSSLDGAIWSTSAEEKR